MSQIHLSHSQRPRAFTLIELLVTIAILAILAAMLLPTLTAGKRKAQGLQCLNNHRQLCLAWMTYVMDSNENLPFASSTSLRWRGTGIDQQTWCTGTLNFVPSNRSNWDPDVDIKKSPLWSYCGRNLGVWKCPADNSVVKDNNNVTHPRVRSMSMNLYLGAWGGTDGGYGGYVSDFKIFRKYQELRNPGFAQTFVFVDMRSDSIDMANFAVNMAGWPDLPKLYQFWDLPGFYHHRAAGFSFADGHSEMKRWRDGRTMPPLIENKTQDDMIDSMYNPDIAWLQDHATRPTRPK